MSDIHLEGKHIRFVLYDSRPKTFIWRVVAKDGDVSLGLIKWFGRWRRYCFFPDSDTVFEEQCMRDIIHFMEDRTESHIQKRKELKNGHSK